MITKSVTKWRALGLICLFQTLGLCQAQLPALKKNGAVTQMFVDGKPFLMLAGELHNSSASSIDYMKPIWNHLSELNLNTVIGTVNWELLEPEEGKFDFTLVDAQINEARVRNMRLVLIWFATWKNATSTYAPLWVKLDTRRFPRVATKPRPDLRSSISSYFAESMPLPNLSAFGEETLAADIKAFRALMSHLREVDTQHTVIMMQVENETGLLADSRDRSPLAEAAWSKPVPRELIDYLVKNKANLLPEMLEVWGARDFKTSGTWPEVFGTSNHADQVFMAWYVGRFVGKVIEGGKAELPLPMYVNAWLGPQPGMDQPGQYPSGGPVARVMDVWRAAAPAADLFAPDIYVPDFKGTCALYTRSGNPFFIPEARADVGNLFWAVGQESAMGFSPFGIEDVKKDNELADAYRFLGNMGPLITKAQAEKRIIGVILENDKPAVAQLAGYQLKITSPSKSTDTKSFGLVISTAPDEFLIVGSGLFVNFTPVSPGPKIAEIGSLDEGVFDKGEWIAGRRLNGDEGRPILRSGQIGAIKIRLYRRDE